jgi:hypothetical protein
MKITAIITIMAVVAYRLAGPLAGGWVSEFVANFSPLAAVIVAGGIYLPRPAARWVPFGALLLSTLGANLIHQRPLIDQWSVAMLALFGLLAAAVAFLRVPRRIAPVLVTTVAASVIFYLLSNSLSWLYDPSYGKNFAGWFQSLTTGVPGYAPTWVFGLKSLISDLFFTGLMIAACHPRKQASAPSLTEDLTPCPTTTA